MKFIKNVILTTKREVKTNEIRIFIPRYEYVLLMFHFNIRVSLVLRAAIYYII